MPFDYSPFAIGGLDKVKDISGLVPYTGASGGVNLGAYSLTATTAKLTSLTDGYVPYHVSDALGLANSGMFWDNANGRLGIGTATPAAKLDVVGNGRFSTWLNVGTTTDAVANGDFSSGLTGASRMFFDQSEQTLYMYNSAGALSSRMTMGSTSANSTLFSFTGLASFAPTGAENVYTIGANFSPSNTGTANTTGYVSTDGLLLAPTQSGNLTAVGATSSVRGLYATPTFTGSGTLPRLYGAVASPIVNNAGGTVTDVRSLYAQNPIKTAGAITTAYGLYIDSITSGTTNYAIYAAGGQSYFAGNVGIGTASPSAKLHIVGNVFIPNGNDVRISGTHFLGADPDYYSGIRHNMYWGGSAWQYYSNGIAGQFTFGSTDSTGVSAFRWLIADRNTSGVNATVTGRANYMQLLTTRLNVVPDTYFGSDTSASPAAKIHAVKTTEQLRLGYDASNYYSTTIGSTGIVTFDAVGSGASFVFSDTVQASGYKSSDGSAGWTGTFTNGDGATVTVKNGLIVSVA